MNELERLRRDATRAWERGALGKAEKLLDAALRRAPRDAELHRQRALCLHRRGAHDQARAALRRALQLAPEHALIHMNLGSMAAAVGEVTSAIAHLRRACDLDPDSGAAWYNLGKALKLNAEENEARQALERAVALRPGHAPSRTVLGDVLKILGEAEAAEHALRDALALDPGSAHAWWSLANLKVAKLDHADLARIEAVLASPRPQGRERAMLLFALGRGLEQHEHWDACLDTLHEANRIMRGILPWSRQAFSATVDAVIEAFAACAPRTAVHADGAEPAPIFIVGLPRTGSTLIEQILAAHSTVVAASELSDLPAVLDAESARRGQPFAEWAAHADTDTWARLGREYLERTRRWWEGRPGCRVTDKLPNNMLHVGAILRMFPAARVIASDRDPLDTCWSCYQQYFAYGQAFTYDLDDLVDYYLEFRRLDACWLQLAPDRYLRMGYETLVADSGSAIRALLDFLGLAEEPACLEPQHARRSVRSASAAQVREPIDRRGEGRARPLASRLTVWHDRLQKALAGTD